MFSYRLRFYVTVASQHVSHISKNDTSKAPGQLPRIVATAYHRSAYSDQPQVGIQWPIMDVASIRGTRSQKKVLEHAAVETQQFVSQPVQRRCSVFHTTILNEAITSHQKWPFKFFKGATQNQVQFTQSVQLRHSITRMHTQINLINTISAYNTFSAIQCAFRFSNSN